jgi:hypothetical protein
MNFSWAQHDGVGVTQGQVRCEAWTGPDTMTIGNPGILTVAQPGSLGRWLDALALNPGARA